MKPRTGTKAKAEKDNEHDSWLNSFFVLDAITHLYKRLCPSVCSSIYLSVFPVLFSNNELGHF